MLDAEADQLCGAGRTASQARQDTRAGSYDRTLQTSAGEVNLKIPKLRRQTFETAIIERYRRRESSVEESLIEMYLAGISVRRVEDITEALWGRGWPEHGVEPQQESTPRSRLAEPAHRRRTSVPLSRCIVMKRTWAGESAMSLCWWPAPSIRRVFGRFWASARAPRRTNPAGRRSCATCRPRPQRRAAHHLRRLPRLDGSAAVCPTLSGSAAWFIFIGRLQPCAGPGPRGEPHAQAISQGVTRPRKRASLDLRAASAHGAIWSA